MYFYITADVIFLIDDVGIFLNLVAVTLDALAFSIDLLLRASRSRDVSYTFVAWYVDGGFLEYDWIGAELILELYDPDPPNKLPVVLQKVSKFFCCMILTGYVT